MASERDDDAYPNEIMVAGGLWMAVSQRFRSEPVMVNGQATNELYVWPEFMKSRYRVMVILDPEPFGQDREVADGNG